MPIDIDALRKDPEYQALVQKAPKDAEALLQQAMRENAGLPPTPTASPGLVDPVLKPVGDALAPALGKIATQAALPTVGSLALGVGGRFVPGLNVLPPPVREAAGSILGTGANMLLGIEEPSWQQLLMAGATPAAARRTGNIASRVLPGAAGARAAGIVDEATQLPTMLRRGVTVEPGAFYTAARTLNPSVALDDTGQVAQDLLATEAQAIKGLKFGRVGTVATELADLAKQAGGTQVTELRLSPIVDDLGRPIMREEVIKIIPAKDGSIPLAQLDVVRQRIGALIGLVKDPQERGAYKQLYGSLLKDIERAATQEGGEGAAALLQGIAQQRRVFAAQDLQDLISGPTGAISQPRPVDGLQTFNAARVIKELERPRPGTELLAQFLEQHPTEKQEILTLLEDMNRRNVKLLPPSGSMFGSGALLARGGAGYAAAKGANALLGTDLDPGTVAAAVAFGTQVISRTLLTPVGRAYLREALAKGPTLNLTQLLVQMTGQGLRASLGPQPGVTLGIEPQERR